jgi:putative transcriptional regulator
MKKTSKGSNSMENSVGAKIIEGLREFTESLEKGDAITERFTCRTVMLELMPLAYGPDAVRATRKILGASQGIFAQFLGVSIKSVRAWEQGVNIPSDIACRFMDEIQRNPEFWRKRFMESITIKRGTDVQCMY